MTWRVVFGAVAGMLAGTCAWAQDINTATRAELEQLNGVGVTMADRILDERARAPFKSWDDFERRVKGMRGARTQRLKAQGVTIGGERVSRPDARNERRP
jgi:competence protein ComEA